jgi:hypothetical protein
LVYVVIGHVPPAAAQVDQQRAQEYFKEVQALCERDGGRLWGVSLCRPMVIGDMRTQTMATSQPAPEGARPQVVGLVNAPIEWGGATWGAYVWDFMVNGTPRFRKELMLHELFHAAQPPLGLIVPALASEHLDAVDGRYWLRLEWRALARALRASGEPRALAVGDALAFRQARRMLYPGSVESERAAEITEGLAQYTGTVLAADTTADAITSALDQLVEAETQDSFVRTFAYTSGPAYGLLLDASSPGWTRRVRSTDDLASLVMRALAVQPAADATASAARYGGPELRASEQRREQQRQERIAELRRRFVDGPVLLFPERAVAVSIRGARSSFRTSERCTSAPTAPRAAGAASKRRTAFSSRVMAVPVVYRHPCDATTRRSREMDGRSRRHRDGWCAKEHGGETTKLSGSSREVHDLRARLLAASNANALFALLFALPLPPGCHSRP